MEVTWAQDPSGPITSQAQNYSQKPLVMAAEDGNPSETDGRDTGMYVLRSCVLGHRSLCRLMHNIPVTSSQTPTVY